MAHVALIVPLTLCIVPDAERFAKAERKGQVSVEGIAPLQKGWCLPEQCAFLCGFAFLTVIFGILDRLSKWRTLMYDRH
ncbi:hypothetical protein AB1N83_004174 [Pleurotus pulmonarius]